MSEGEFAEVRRRLTELRARVLRREFGTREQIWEGAGFRVVGAQAGSCETAPAAFIPDQTVVSASTREISWLLYEIYQVVLPPLGLNSEENHAIGGRLAQALAGAAGDGTVPSITTAREATAILQELSRCIEELGGG